jgi:hypothetical protein
MFGSYAILEPSASRFNVSNGTALNSGTSVTRPVRRSTRVDRAIPVTVMGIDSWRGPYREQVSTITISAHGCKYESKYQVTSDSLVILELNGTNPTDPPLSARGRVKWMKRPDNGEMFQTAIELEEPGNIWGLQEPPKDWLRYSQRKSADGVARPKLVINSTATPSAAAPSFARSPVRPSPAVPSLASADPAGSAAQVMAELQSQLQRMVGYAVQTAMRERASEVLAKIHTEIAGEAQRVFAEHLVRQNLEAKARSENDISAAQSAEKAVADWRAKIDADLKRVSEQLDSRTRQLDEHAAALATSTAERVQRVMETTRREEIGRFISRLTEHLNPLLDNAQKISTDLHRTKEEIEKLLLAAQSGTEESTRTTAARMQDAIQHLEEQFQHTIHAKLVSACQELDRSGREVTEGAVGSLRSAVDKYASEARKELGTALQAASGQILSDALNVLNQRKETLQQASHHLEDRVRHAQVRLSDAQAQWEERLKSSTNSILEQTAGALEERAAELRRQFAEEIKEYSRSHLEYIGGAFGELAKGLGKLSKD